MSSDLAISPIFRSPFGETSFWGAVNLLETNASSERAVWIDLSVSFVDLEAIIVQIPVSHSLL